MVPLTDRKEAMTEANSEALNGERHLTPEQLVVENVKALMKVRGVGRSELGKRLNDLGFTSWRHAKTVRSLLDDERSLRVNELFAMAAALNSSMFALTSLGTRPEVFPDEAKSNVTVGEVPGGKGTYESLWFGSPGIEVPTNHLDWASWTPGQPPRWVNSVIRENQRLIDLYQLRGFDPPAPAEELTTAQALEMFKRLQDQLEEEIEE